jgi:hypothetical protein
MVKGMMKALSISRAVAALLAGALLIGCGGGGGGSDGTAGIVDSGDTSLGGNDGTGDADNTTDPVSPDPVTYYLAVRAYDEGNQFSPYSNEAVGTLEPGSSATLTWEAPTRTLAGECASVSGYLVEFGTGSAAYTGSLNLSASSRALTCRATGVDPQCGDIQSCQTQITVPS